MEAHKIIAALRANGNELKELISLSSFIDQVGSLKSGESPTGDEFIDVANYNDLLRVELHFGLFVPCVNGDLIKRDKVYFRAFKDAEKEVVFKDFGVSFEGESETRIQQKDRKIELCFDKKGVLTAVNHFGVDGQDFSIERFQSLFRGIELK